MHGVRFCVDYDSDCHKCAYSISFDDGGGEYEEIVLRCNKESEIVTYVRNDNKPCGLQEGRYYVASYAVNKI